MSEEGGLELLDDVFLAAASLASNSPTFAAKALSWPRSSSQSGHPFPSFMAADSSESAKIHKHQFQTREQLPEA
jgi:hypothetical protein